MERSTSELKSCSAALEIISSELKKRSYKLKNTGSPKQKPPYGGLDSKEGAIKWAALFLVFWQIVVSSHHK